MRKLLLFAVLISLASPVLAGSRDDAVARATDPETGAFPEGWAVGPAVFFKSPTYFDRDSTLIPVPAVYYRGGRCSIYVKQGSCRIVGSDSFEFGVLGDLRLDGYDAKDSSILLGMEDRDFSFDVGFSLEFDTPAGDVELEWLTDALSNHDGNEASLSWQIPIVLERWVLRPAVGFHRKSADLADYYYGVRPQEAVSGRPAYAVGSTNTWSFRFAGNHRITRNWLLIILAEYQRYSSDIKNSPIVEDPGQTQAFVGVARYF